MILAIFCSPSLATGQDSTQKEAPVKKSLIILNYYSANNSAQYLKIETKNKLGKKFEPIGDVNVSLFLDSKDSLNEPFVKIRTNQKGEAVTGIPVSMASRWKSASEHTIQAKAEATKNYDESETELSISKAKIEMDTATDGDNKTIQIKILKQNGDIWQAAEGVEMKVDIRRLGGDLMAGEEETYTTDSTGNILVDFKRDSLPGDEKGNLILVAKVDDNENFGNLSLEKTVPWGVAKNMKNDFNKRSLWATGNKAPVWLLFMAFSIMLGVWSVIIYLIIILYKIKKLGTKNLS